MHRDHRQEVGFAAGRHHARKEWAYSSDDPHQMEAREHARQPVKTQRSHDLIDVEVEVEAERQVRELRTRY